MPALLADETKDLELMLAPLRRLPVVSGMASDVQRYLAPSLDPLEVQLSLELNTGEPAVDFVRQLLELAYQVTTTGGVAIPLRVLLVARRMVRHAETVVQAWPETAATHGRTSFTKPLTETDHARNC